MGLPAISILGSKQKLSFLNYDGFRGKDIYIIPDNDEQGKQSSQNLQKQLSEKGISSIIQKFDEKHKDLNEYLIYQKGKLK